MTFPFSHWCLVVNILGGEGSHLFPCISTPCPHSFQIQKVHDCDQTIKNKICLQAIQSTILGIRFWQPWSIGQKKTQRREQKTAPLSSFHKSFIMCRCHNYWKGPCRTIIQNSWAVASAEWQKTTFYLPNMERLKMPRKDYERLDFKNKETAIARGCLFSSVGQYKMTS